ncbi:MAG: hypothetical protein V1684_00285 [bacterium]
MPLFKRQREFVVKVDEMALPEVVRQLVKERELPLKTKQQMAQALSSSGLPPADVRALMSGQKKIKPMELKKLGDILVKGKIEGLGKYASGTSLLKSYIREQKKKQARFYLYRQQREDEEKAPARAGRQVSINEQRSGETSALAEKSGVSSIFEKQLPSAPVAPPAKNPRIKLPF